MDNIDNFFIELNKDLDRAQTRKKMLLLKRRSKIFMKHLKESPYATKMAIIKTKKKTSVFNKKIISKLKNL